MAGFGQAFAFKVRGFALDWGKESMAAALSLPKCRAYSLPCYADSAIRRIDKMLYGIK